MCNFYYENVKPKLNSVGLKCIITHVNANCATVVTDGGWRNYITLTKGNTKNAL